MNTIYTEYNMYHNSIDIYTIPKYKGVLPKVYDTARNKNFHSC